MRSTQTILEGGSWDTKRSTGSVLLPFHDRYRRRIVLCDARGEKFLLNLLKPAILRDGDGLLLDDGGVITVRAADEKVADIYAPTSAEIARLAWHIGNRHTPLQVLADGGLRIHNDTVLIDMLLGLGATVTRRNAAFSPERGAYDRGAAADHHNHHRDHHQNDHHGHDDHSHDHHEHHHD